MRLSLTVNGERVEREAEPRTHLVDFLRVALGLTGSHAGCEHGSCGACTLRLDGVAVRGCLVLAVQADGCRVETVEGMAADPAHDDLREAFVARNALQCGYCTPGMLATAAAILEEAAAARRLPSREEIRAEMSGNYCRCTGYHAIVDAVEDVARSRAGAASADRATAAAAAG